jgi:hypothetical protein
VSMQSARAVSSPLPPTPPMRVPLCSVPSGLKEATKPSCPIGRPAMGKLASVVCPATYAPSAEPPTVPMPMSLTVVTPGPPPKVVW